MVTCGIGRLPLFKVSVGVVVVVVSSHEAECLPDIEGAIIHQAGKSTVACPGQSHV